MSQREDTAEGPRQPWHIPAEQVLYALGTDAETGLSDAEASRRRKRYGFNQLRQMRRRTAWRILFDQLTSIMIGLLTAASILSFLLVDWIEGTAIAVVIVINTAIGFFSELKATRSMEALYSLGQVTARIRRNGKTLEVPASGLVPGDILLLEAGDVVTADLRIIADSRLQADESTLTGESVPVTKSIDPVAADAPLPDRSSMLFKGTAIARGSGMAVVVATGLATELGKITALVEQTETAATPLEQRLERLSHRLIWITLGCITTVGTAGILVGQDVLLMAETAIALAVATVPEGLPLVATIALARGMWRMAERNALITRLSAVETLGATSVICTDKTGTLTENQMTVTHLVLSSGEVGIGGNPQEPVFERSGERIDPIRDGLLMEALETGVLCNNADVPANVSSGNEAALGDPMEVALLVAGAKAGLYREKLLQLQPEVREDAFDPETKMMATYHQHANLEGGLRIAVKGAPEAVIAVCHRLRTIDGVESFDESRKQEWLSVNTRLAADGMRVLALASAQTESGETVREAFLDFIGLVGLMDPPRQDVRDALDHCRAAGIEVVMVTGDQAPTALHVAEAIGLIDHAEAEAALGSELTPPGQIAPEQRDRLARARVFARVTPRQKLDLIALHQAGGAVVGMTGDGVNDAPALKKADIGIAMGQRGTQVAREAADMVLRDDSFKSIVVGIEQGRVIFTNIRKFAIYLLSCNLSEVLVVALATLANAPLPLLPLQILFLNLVTDVWPALALGVGQGEADVMRHPPRPAGEPILSRGHWIGIAAQGGLITLSTLGAFWVAMSWMDIAPVDAVTISFLTLSLAQLWHVFNMRGSGSNLFRNDITSNGFVWGALLLCAAILALAIYFDPLAMILGIRPPDTSGWFLIITASLIPLTVGQLYLSLGTNRSR